MLYLSVEPQPPLSEFVERLWLAIDGQVPRKERILPNGTVELVVNLREDRVHIDGVGDTACHKSVAGVAVSGAYSKVFIIDAMQHEAMLGVHFRPGGASVVLGVPSGELTNAHADLAGLWGPPPRVRCGSVSARRSRIASVFASSSMR